MDLLGKVHLLGEPGSVTVARMYIHTVLVATRREAVEDAELLVAELVANAIKHSRSGRERGVW
ncbi:hypothetical protein [Sphaerisporangium rubeum]|uniref:Anti-sigma regulatory factor (Ser/Thr protein kinase) n=1 Tax=Sphaerisporangium rubeum TaxID=321317 RepID=A0A7X0IKD9_9ACTN|nr:hypothetical protein [Sphaerisporangium rubeum]MBB6476560.1 anti-sigma regulatory factor (Ser/Thr protein kinase) [Sphaerisporangium rubeum]